MNKEKAGFLLIHTFLFRMVNVCLFIKTDSGSEDDFFAIGGDVDVPPDR